MQRSLFCFGITILTLLNLSCGHSDSSTGSSTQSSFAFTEEPAFCDSVKPVADGVVVSAQAQFFARQVTSSGLLGPGPAEAIKYAEVAVLSSTGVQVQCGMSDGTGQISLMIPKLPGKYTLVVYSRADNAAYKVSVLNNPSQNLPYSIQSGFTLTEGASAISVALTPAPFDGTLEGGAFNIMNQIYQANAYIRQNSSCPTLGDACKTFTVAPKIRAYWSRGLSPYAYYGSASTALSFYSKLDDPAYGVRRGLYIQGGIKGEVNCSDTDHFDNSVILHEYGHFLEDSFAKSDSPGGSHSGNSVIDPRLAWSEGWANFFQTAVLNTAVYQDTIGNSACTGGTFLGVNLNLETPTAGQDKMPAGTMSGEGVFREVSVSRWLWDVIDAGGPDGGAGIGFAPVWKVFSDSSAGFQNPQVHFRNAGRFNLYLRDMISSLSPATLPPLDSAMNGEYQVASNSIYGQPLTFQPAGSCSFNLQGVADGYSMGTFVSNQLKSNAFYEIHYDGTNSQIDLHYTGVSPSDLDLFLYTEDYVFDESATILRSSSHLYPESAGAGLESINLSGLSPGTYMLNVRVNTNRLGQVANYYLSHPSGARFCP